MGKKSKKKNKDKKKQRRSSVSKVREALPAGMMMVSVMRGKGYDQITGKEDDIIARIKAEMSGGKYTDGEGISKTAKGGKWLRMSSVGSGSTVLHTVEDVDENIKRIKDADDLFLMNALVGGEEEEA